MYKFVFKDVPAPCLVCLHFTVYYNDKLQITFIEIYPVYIVIPANKDVNRSCVKETERKRDRVLNLSFKLS